MRRLLSRFLAFVAPFLLPKAKWTDGVVSNSLRWDVLYALLVTRIAAVRPDAIQQPVKLVTVRIYDRFPHPFENNWGKVLAPNVIIGDTSGTLCMRKDQVSDALFDHECFHAITGIGDHPAWAYKQDNNQFFLNI